MKLLLVARPDFGRILITSNISPARRDDITHNEAIYSNSVGTCPNYVVRMLLPWFDCGQLGLGAVHPGSITRIILSGSDHSRVVTSRQ